MIAIDFMIESFQDVKGYSAKHASRMPNAPPLYLDLRDSQTAALLACSFGALADVSANSSSEFVRVTGPFA
jgi:hypothetical protein